VTHTGHRMTTIMKDQLKESSKKLLPAAKMEITKKATWRIILQSYNGLECHLPAAKEHQLHGLHHYTFLKDSLPLINESQAHKNHVIS